MKKIFAFIMACCMALCVSGIAYAAEPENKTDYMNYDFPEDAIVLYQGEDGVVLYAGGKLLFSKYVYQTDGEVHAEFNSISKDITIQYSTVKVSSQGGIRVMCWLW